MRLSRSIAVVIGVVLFGAYLFLASDCGCRPEAWLGTKWGYVDRQGKEIIPVQFGMASDFHDGIARVGFMQKYGRFNRHPGVDTSGYIDRTGHYTISPMNGLIGEFHDGLAVAYRKSFFSRKSGYIDKTGRFVIEPRFGYAGDFSEGLASVIPGTLNRDPEGCIDTTGRMVIKPMFYGVQEFSEGRAVVNVSGLPNLIGPYGYIDRNGRLITSQNFQGAGKFEDGFALVQLRDDENYIDAYIDRDGAIVREPASVRGTRPRRAGPTLVYIGPKTRMIAVDSLGKLEAAGSVRRESPDSPDLLPARRYSEGLAVWQAPHTYRYGFIDTTGKTVIQPTFDQVREFKGGIAAVCVGQSWGFIDKTGKFVIQPKYQWVSDFSDGLAAVCVGPHALRQAPRYH